MRPSVFFAIAAEKRFIHSCCPSLSVAVASFMTNVLLSCATAPAQMKLNARPAAVPYQFLLVIITFPFSSKPMIKSALENLKQSALKGEC